MTEDEAICDLENAYDYDDYYDYNYDYGDEYEYEYEYEYEEECPVNVDYPVFFPGENCGVLKMYKM